MFPIMTDEQIAAADEMTLRARVRELSTAISQLADIAHQMREQNTILRGTHATLYKCHGILATLLTIATDTPRFDHIDRRPRSRKPAKRKAKKRK